MLNGGRVCLYSGAMGGHGRRGAGKAPPRSSRIRAEMRMVNRRVRFKRHAAISIDITIRVKTIIELICNVLIE
jgi:hypothetical protein